MPVSEVENKYLSDFQTPPPVCKYMASLIPEGVRSILEPTPGRGNIVIELAPYQVTSPTNYFDLDKNLRFDCVVMNPPFSSKYAFACPPDYENIGMQFGYKLLTECMLKSDNIIALVPWFTISDSDTRLRKIKRFGLVSVTALPRKTFQYARIQTVILQLEKGYTGETKFIVFDCLHDEKQPKFF